MWHHVERQVNKDDYTARATTVHSVLAAVFINPLTTECTHHATLATCYQLAHSVLKIGFALAKEVG